MSMAAAAAAAVPIQVRPNDAGSALMLLSGSGLLRDNAALHRNCGSKLLITTSLMNLGASGGFKKAPPRANSSRNLLDENTNSSPAASPRAVSPGPVKAAKGPATAA